MARTLSPSSWSGYRRTRARRQARRSAWQRAVLALLPLAMAGSCTEARLASSAASTPAPVHAAAVRSAAARTVVLPANVIADLSNMSPEPPASTALEDSAPVPPPTLAGPAARPFSLAGHLAAERGRAELCLASAIYYEANSESDDGERAVAQVVLNRVRHPAFPASVCGVVYQGSENPNHCQFTFACDGSMSRHPVSPGGWARASRIAAEALGGAVFKPVGLAINYHTLWVAPRWSPALVPAAVIGAHIFYRLEGAAGAPSAFGQGYAAREPLPGPHTPVAPISPATEATTLLAAATFPGVPVAVSSQASTKATIDNDVGATAAPPITPEDQVLPRWRDSGTWLRR